MWPAAQMQRTIFVGVVDAGEHGRDEVGELDPARRGVEDVGRDLQAVPDLRPPPLRRIGAADRREQLRRVRLRGLGDRDRFGRRRCGPSTATRAPRGCPASADRSPAAAPARPPAAASSRSCRRRCRSRGRARTRRSRVRRRQRAADRRRAAPRRSRPDSAARGAAASDRAARPARRSDSRTRACRPTRPSARIDDDGADRVRAVVDADGETCVHLSARQLRTVRRAHASSAHDSQAPRSPSTHQQFDPLGSSRSSRVLRGRRDSLRFSPTRIGDTTSSTSGPVPARAGLVELRAAARGCARP